MAIDLSLTTAVVTGASSGIGAALARGLAARGADLVLVARREPALAELASSLRAEHGVRALALPADLTDPDAPQRLAGALQQRGVRAGTLVNSAGFGSHGPFAETDPRRVRDEVQVDVAALVGLTRALLPDLLATGRGAVLNLASTAAVQPTPQMAVYGASKAFVLSFTEALSYELRGTGVHAMAVCPGPTRTEFFDVVGTGAAAVGRFQTAGEVAAETFAALDRRRPPASLVTGRHNRAQTAVSRLVPRRLATSVAARALGQRPSARLAR